MLAHRVPPMHGAAIIGDLVYSTLKGKNIKTIYIGLAGSKNIRETGNLSITKILLLVNIVKDLIINLYRYRPNIIYTTPSVSGMSFYKDLIYLLIIKFYKYIFWGCRVLVHLHMRPFKTNYVNKKYLYRFLFSKSEIIFLSNKLIDDFTSKDLQSSITHILPNTILPIINKKEALANSKNFDHIQTKINKRLNVLYLGHMIKSKGYRLALDISKNVIKENNSYHFHFVGEYGSDDDSQYFNDFIFNNNLSKNIHYFGSCDNNVSKAKLFMDNDIMILPSYTEAMPLVILEALSTGTPVIATNTGAISDLIGNGYGKLIDYDNERNFINNFSKALIHLPYEWDSLSSSRCIEKYYSTLEPEKFKKKLIQIIKFE